MSTGWETAMDENLFNVAAKLQADRRRFERQVAAVGKSVGAAAEVSSLTRQLLALGAALLINAAVLGSVQWSAYSARPVPQGQVIITELDTAEVRVASN